MIDNSAHVYKLKYKIMHFKPISNLYHCSTVLFMEFTNLQFTLIPLYLYYPSKVIPLYLSFFHFQAYNSA